MFKISKAIKRTIKYFLKKSNYLYYFGDFKTWELARIESQKYGDSYQGQAILQQVADATQKVRRGEGEYEQDGIVFDEECNNYELLACLFYIHSVFGHLNVIDFGGALGSAFFRYRKLFRPLKVQWNIIEQEHYVRYGKEHVPEVNFCFDIHECQNNGNVILLSSVLPYLDDTYGVMKDLLEQNIDFIILDETAFSPDETEKIMLQHVPASIYSATYPIRLMSLVQFKKFVNENGYEIMWEWDYRFGNIPLCDGLKVTDSIEKGFLLKRKA